jgi:hypothetical protein
MKKVKSNSFSEETTTSVFDLTLHRYDYNNHTLYFLSHRQFYFDHVNLLITGFISKEIINDFVDDIDGDVDMENCTLEEILEKINNSDYTIKKTSGLTLEDKSYLNLYKALKIIKEEL